ncbi:MAG TPA: 2OG-Fe(II) oxygenase [Rudaea sp.]|nr:2OG-Fe(II) oxygenase [Rudaea sp.]
MSAVLPAPTELPAARDLSRYVRWFDRALEPDFCAQMIESFERLARFHARNGRGVMTELKESAWTELNVSKVADADMQQFFRAQVFRYLERYNGELGLTLPIPARERLENLRIKRYFAEGNDQFQPHFDAIDYTSNRYLVFLWYLNDVADGGETEFPDLGLRVSARAGRLLVFPPYWMFQHAGLPPRSNDKYIISTYLLF